MRWTRAWLAAFAVAVGAYAWVLGRAQAPSGYADFGQFHASVTAGLDGRPMYPVLDQGDRSVYNLNPPHFHLLLLPLAPLPVGWAFAIWTAAGCACLVLVLGREIRDRWASRRDPAWPVVLFGWLFVAPMTASVLATGAPVWLLLPVLVAAWRADLADRPVRAGALLGVVCSVKPFMGVFVPWFVWRREWRALGAMAGSAGAAILAGLAIFGVEAYQEWLDALAASGSWAWGQLNASVAGAIARGAGDGPHWAPWLAPRLRYVVLACLSGPIVAATARAVFRGSRERAWAVLPGAALLLTPLGWVYYLWWLWPALPLAARHWSWWGGWALLTLPPAAVFAGQPSALATATLGAVYTWGLWLVWFSLLDLAPPPATDASRADRT